MFKEGLIMNGGNMTYEEVCETLREELENAFEIYFNENLKQLYMRGVWESDDFALDSVEASTFKFMDDYVMERLQDEF